MVSDTAVRADALLDGLELSEDTERQACIVLASVALRKAAGDTAAAKESLSWVLEAVGVIPYEPAIPRTFWGERGKTGAGQ